MNILFLCDEYPPGHNGGIGSVTRSLAQEMVRQGHVVFVVGLYTYEYGEADYEEDNGVKVWRLRYGFKLPRISKFYAIQRRIPNNIKRLLFAERDFKRYIKFIEHLVEEQKIDIVEQPDWVSYGYFLGIEKPILPSLPVPLVLKFHGSHSYHCFELKIASNNLFSTIDKEYYNRADALVAVSEHCAKINKIILGNKMEVEVLYNSIEMPQYNNFHYRETKLVFYSGTIKETKGAFSLLKAWNLVQNHIPEAKLVLFGKGNIQEALQLINPKFLSSVIFKGHQPRKQLFEMLETATLAVFPSYTETFGLAPVEAMAYGCPTIFTKRSCGPEIITDGVTGLLVEPTDINEIAEKIIMLLNNEPLRKKLGDAGQKEVRRRFEISDSVIDHIDFYQKVIHQFHN